MNQEFCQCYHVPYFFYFNQEYCRMFVIGTFAGKQDMAGIISASLSQRCVLIRVAKISHSLS